MIGLMLFAEQNAVENMPKAVRRRLAGPGTWREAVQHALEALGGQASLTDIYRAVEPRRPSPNQFWRDKVRQTLGLYFKRSEEHTSELQSLIRISYAIFCFITKTIHT